MLIGMNQVEEVIRIRTVLDDPANKRARGELYGDRVWWEAISKGVLSWKSLYLLARDGVSLKRASNSLTGRAYTERVRQALEVHTLPAAALVWGGVEGPNILSEPIQQLQAVQQDIRQQCKAKSTLLEALRKDAQLKYEGATAVYAQVTSSSRKMLELCCS